MLEKQDTSNSIGSILEAMRKKFVVKRVDPLAKALTSVYDESQIERQGKISGGVVEANSCNADSTMNMEFTDGSETIMSDVDMTRTGDMANVASILGRLWPTLIKPLNEESMLLEL